MSLEVEPAIRINPAARPAAGLFAIATLAAMLAPLTACSTTERDRYYSSRSVVIPAQAGDGRTTLAAWPYGQPSPPAATARANSAFDIAP